MRHRCQHFDGLILLQTKLNVTPKKKTGSYEGNLEKFPHKKIYINVGHLEKGDYELNIVHKNKLITKTTFKKP